MDSASSSTESCPLLSDQSTLEAQSAANESTPLPKVQLAALCFVRAVDPIAFTQPFPYVNEFMSDLRVTDDPSKVGFYSGIVVSECPVLPQLRFSVARHRLRSKGEHLCSLSAPFDLPVGQPQW